MADRWQWSGQGAARRKAVGPAAGIWLLILLSPWVQAAGTAAGSLIANTATMQFAIEGSVKETRSNTTRTRVDEVLDVVVTAEQAEAVAIDSPAENAVVSFLVTNTGNGTEDYRLFLDLHVNEGGFDPSSGQLHLESNGIPGLQTGAGGDLTLVEGTPVTMPAGGMATVYAVATIPGALAAAAESQIRLRAVSSTLAAAAGVADPDAPEFPPPGTSYPGAGDGNTHAVVGLTHSSAQPVFFALSGFRVDGPVVTLDKTAVAVRSDDGTGAVVSGAVVDYQLKIDVRGTGAITGALLTDALPAELEFLPGSLVINGSAEDDDLEPAGGDSAGFDPATGTLLVALGDVDLAAGPAVHVVTFSATIR